jgi:hypothetical protein
MGHQRGCPKGEPYGGTKCISKLISESQLDYELSRIH